MMDVIVFGYSIKVWEMMAVVGVSLAMLEIFAPGFILLPIGLAFLTTAAVAVFVNTWLAVLTALALSLCFLIWLFQFQLKLGRKGLNIVDTNADGIVGKEVVVTQALQGADFGEVKLYGDRWRAYSLSQKSYGEGERALVVKVDGNKLALD